MAKFFIERPVFAWVIAIIIMLAGVISIKTLPVAQYPNVAPPTISVAAMYPGASAQVVQDGVAQIIEQNMTGIDNMRYMESTSSGDGSMSLTLTFEPGTNPDTAQMQVQNKMQLAMPLLPKEVQQQGVTVRKSTRNFLVIAGFYSEDGSMNETDISDYVATQIQDPISRLPGVGDVTFFGSKYAMRIWLNPTALTNYSLTVADVIAAVTAQNVQVSVGELSGTPATPGARLDATVVAQTRLTNTTEFGNILLRVNPDGSQVRLKDVARLEKDRETYSFRARYNGQPAGGLGIYLAAGANALSTSDNIHRTLDELSKYFPPGLKVVYPQDTAPYVRLSIEEVVKTLLEAIVLVFLVMFLFLQSIRATLIPTIAVPVVLLGTFAVLSIFGYSINTLTMFGLVLAIGLLVDDAIVVVENVERIMHEENLSPHDATVKSMGQITGALVGIATVLAAVFLPMAFMSGSTGVIYRQFSITVASAMVLSVIIALVLTPTLCAALLKPKTRDTHAEQRRGFFGWFNRAFDRGTHGYTRGVGGILARPWRFLLIYAAIFAATIFFYLRLPTAFLPNEDQGIIIMQATLPAGATQEQATAVLAEVERYFHEQETEAVEATFTVAGFSFGGRGQNATLGFIKLKPWDERLAKTNIIHKLLQTLHLEKTGKDNSADAVANRGTMYFQTRMKVAMTFAMTPPAITELGAASGFELRLLDREGLGHPALVAASNQLLYAAYAQPTLVTSVRVNGFDDNPQFHLDIDQEKASTLGLNLADINNTISVAWGASYINDFVDRGRTKRVYMQGDAPYRMTPEDIGNWHVRNNHGQMISFDAFTTNHWEFGPPALNRFNGFPSITIQGAAAPGQSTGTAMDTMQNIVEKQLPPGISLAWSGLSYEEKQAGAQVPILYLISFIVIFLCLAALYESWTIPIAVILVAPLGVFGAVLAVTTRHFNSDIYFQVGFLTTLGLSSKNGILIVEFAKDAYDQGMTLMEATLHAVRIRLRPILMTSLAFGCGVIPLAIATGAGSGSQNAIGTSVFGGVITGTFLAIFLVPLFYVTVTKLFRSKPRKQKLEIRN